jgi:enamine deaminase RidA (YjgF/YER057c/UK114 family)
MSRQTYSTGTKWEPVVGYSRGVRIGPMVCISGCTATNEEGQIVGATPYEQALQVLKNLERALGALGADLSDVIRTRTYVTDISRWEEVGRAHGEVFGTIRPATSMVEVSKLISPEIVVEIEADAYVERPQL